MNSFAISSKGVGDALIRSASALAAANNTLDESIALATAMNSTVQNPEKVGNALKTLAAYLRSSKVELEELGETGELIAITTPKLNEKMVALTHGSVQILERDGETLRSTYDIMRDLSKIWDTGFLTDVEQAAILEMIAGKRQSSTVASLLQNFTTAEEVLATTAKSAGSAVRENEKYLESINGKIAQFQAAFEQLSSTVLGSEFVKNSYTFFTNIISGLNEVLSLTNGVSSAISALISIAGGAMMSMASNPLFKLWDVTSTGNMSFTPSSYLTSLGDAWNTNRAIEQSIGIIRDYNSTVAAGKDISDQFTASILESDQKLGGYFTSLKGGVGTVQGYAAYLSDAGHSLDVFKVKTIAATAVTKLLNAVLNATIIFAITTAISAAISAIDNYNKRLDTAIDKTEKLNAEWEELQKQNENDIKTVESLSDEFKELAKGVDEAGKNVSLTSEQYDRYREIVDTLIEISPSLVKGYNDERDAIIDKNNAIERSIELLKKEDRVEKIRRSTTEYLTDLLEGYGATLTKDFASQSDAYKSYSKAATAFVSGGGNTLSVYQAQEILKAVGLAGTSLQGMTTPSRRDEVTQIDGTKFAAAFMNEIVQHIDEINPQLLGYDSFGELQNAYRDVLAAQNEINKTKDLVDATLEDIKQAFYPAVESIEGWDELPATARQAVYDYIDNYITGYRQLFTVNKFNGDYEPDEDKIRSALSQITGMTLSVFDDTVTDLIEKISKARDQLKSGKISQSQYRDQYNTVMSALGGTDIDRNLYGSIQTEFDPSAITSAFREIQKAAEEADQAVQSIMEGLNVDANGFAEALNFDEAIASINELGESFSGVADALLTVRDGTMLTEQEISKLIAQYPELASAANLYAADTIEGQQAILENFLQTKEAQYNAEIDTQVARLTAEQTLLEQQVELENAKLAAIADMRAKMDEESLINEKAYQAALDEINQIGAENYATIQDGEVAYNADALSRMLASDKEYAEHSEDEAWEPHADDIADDIDAAYEAATSMLDEMLDAEKNALEAFRVGTLVPYSNDVAKALLGEEPTGGYSSGYKARNDYTKIDPRHKGTVANLNDYEILSREGMTVLPEIDKSVYDKVNKEVGAYLDAAERVATANKKLYEAEIEAIKNQISTFNSLKGIDFATVYGKAPSSKSSSSKSNTDKSKSGSGSSEKEAKQVEIYIADLDEYYKAEKKLAQVQFERAQIEAQLDDTTDLKEKIELERQLADKYGEEAAAQEELLKLKEQTINANVEVLRQLGFEAEYNSATHSLYIDNMEHLNELVADSKGEYETLDEATNALRQSTEKMISSTETLTSDVGSAADAMRNCGKSAEEAKARIIQYLNEMVS